MTTNTAPANIEQKALELVDKLQNLAVEMAPKTWELTLAAVRVQGIVDLIIGGLTLALTIALGKAAVWFGNKASRNGSEGLAVPCVLFGLGAFFNMFMALIKLLDSNNWIAAIEPAAALALKALNF